MDLVYLRKILDGCWSYDTCYPKCKNEWSINNKTLGQCAVTSLIVNDYFGYDICKCKILGVTHYFNINKDEIIDLTKEQFNSSVNYQDIELVTREYILTNEDTRNRYLLLKNRVILGIENNN